MPGYSRIKCWESVRSYLHYNWNRDIDGLVNPGSSFITYNLETTFTYTESEDKKIKANILHDIEVEFKDGRFKYSVIYREYKIETNTKGASRDQILASHAKCFGSNIIKIYYSTDEW